MNKSYRFKAKYIVEAKCIVELNESQQEELKTADLTLIITYIDEEGFAGFMGDVIYDTEEYEVLNYEEINTTEEFKNVALTNLDICFFTYSLSGNGEHSNFIYDNNAGEEAIKAYIIKSPKHDHMNIIDSDIHNLTINR